MMEDRWYESKSNPSILLPVEKVLCRLTALSSLELRDEPLLALSGRAMLFLVPLCAASSALVWTAEMSNTICSSSSRSEQLSCASVSWRATRFKLHGVALLLLLKAGAVTLRCIDGRSTCSALNSFRISNKSSFSRSKGRLLSGNRIEFGPARAEETLLSHFTVDDRLLSLPREGGGEAPRNLETSSSSSSGGGGGGGWSGAGTAAWFERLGGCAGCCRC
mmetsp:Transcript_27570/g.38964  ORF Transcript_27570/g.38964 Transcript_27570/m.38964 type:complete len:220 (-) Transcript_27570:159-818(-)